jgi:hypothetical protein
MLRFLLSLLLGATTAATALSINTTGLQPWQIPSLSTFSPSGYPAGHPYPHLRFTVSDPNTVAVASTHFGPAEFLPSGANCTVWWLAETGDPTGTKDGGRPWTNTCDFPSWGSVAGKWTFQMLNGSSTEGMTLRIMLEEAVILEDGSVVNVKWAGEAAFTVGGNMAGECGGSGVCYWGLKDEDAPVLVNQTLVEVKCVYGGCAKLAPSD